MGYVICSNWCVLLDGGISVSDDDEIDYSVKPEFYDSDLDNKDESWVSSKRKGKRTDAVLSCPACFTTLCLECQRYFVASMEHGIFQLGFTGWNISFATCFGVINLAERTIR